MHDVIHYKHRDGTPFPIEDCQDFVVLHEGRVLIGHQDVFIRKDGGFLDVVYSSSPIKTGDRIDGRVVVFRPASGAAPPSQSHGLTPAL